MIDPIRATRWGYRGLFVALAVLFTFLRILPLSTLPTAWPGPDLLLCVTLAWVLRRPEFVPPTIIALVFLTEDLVFLRPPGLWALTVLLGSEFLRTRESAMRGLPFLGEWAVVGVVMVTMMLIYRIVLSVFVVPQGSLGFALLQVLSSLVAYPVVVAVTRFGFGLRRPVAGELDALGHRL